MHSLLFLGEVASGTVDFQPIITALTSAITPAQIVTILASVIGVGMGFVLLWFGVRKIASIFNGAFKKGKVTV